VKNPELKQDCETYALAIGWCVVAGGYAGGWVSGGCFNPAVACGLGVSNIVFGGAASFNMILYTLFELAGALLAVALHLVLEGTTPELAKVCISEFVGTLVLVATVGLSVLCPKDSAGALPIAASLLVMIYALALVSGANFNPAVSVCLVAAQKMEGSLLIPYIVSQVLGGLAGAGIFSRITAKSIPLGPQKMAGQEKEYSWAAVSFAEVTYTFLLCFVILNVATLNDTDEHGHTVHMLAGGKAQHMYGVAIGFCVIVGGFAIGGISGGSLNPAVSIGLDITSGKPSGNCAIYSVLEILGGCIAAALFYVLRDEQFKKSFKSSDMDYGATANA
jgi:glycerol uptake facilitator-like aquaporin